MCTFNVYKDEDELLQRHTVKCVIISIQHLYDYIVETFSAKLGLQLQSIMRPMLVYECVVIIILCTRINLRTSETRTLAPYIGITYYNALNT